MVSPELSRQIEDEIYSAFSKALVPIRAKYSTLEHYVVRWQIVRHFDD